MDIPSTLQTLIDRWCERRAIRPLQLLLRAYPAPLTHPHQMMELLDALKEVGGLCRGELLEEELRMVIEAQNAIEEAVKSGGKSC
jgi:hypothetical protein